MDDLALYRRLARQAAASWHLVAVLFLVSLLASPLALLAPLPLKIAVDSVLGSRPLPGLLDALLPEGATRSTAGLLILVAALAVFIALANQLQVTVQKYLTVLAGERRAGRGARSAGRAPGRQGVRAGGARGGSLRPSFRGRRARPRPSGAGRRSLRRRRRSDHRRGYDDRALPGHRPCPLRRAVAGRAAPGDGVRRQAVRSDEDDQPQGGHAARVPGERRTSVRGARRAAGRRRAPRRTAYRALARYHCLRERVVLLCAGPPGIARRLLRHCRGDERGDRRRNWRRQDHAHQLAHPSLRPQCRSDSAGRRGPPGLSA